MKKFELKQVSLGFVVCLGLLGSFQVLNNNKYLTLGQNLDQSTTDEIQLIFDNYNSDTKNNTIDYKIISVDNNEASYKLEVKNKDKTEANVVLNEYYS